MKRMKYLVKICKAISLMEAVEQEGIKSEIKEMFEVIRKQGP